MNYWENKSNSFWPKKKVLVTGASGFVGSNLTARLSYLGADVIGISRSGRGKTIKADVVDFSLIDKIIRTRKIQICYHLAAESLVESGQADPYNTFKSNIEGALNVLETARKYSLEKVIIASTSHVYGDHKPPYLERFSPRPSRPYETSKTCIDLIAQSYANTFSLPVLIPRFVNTYGPGDLNFNRLIPKTIKSVLHDESPKMWGGGARRDYLYIDDVIRAYILLGQASMSKIGKNRIYNFGSSNIFSVQEIIEKIIEISGKKFKIQKIQDERDFEIKTQYSSWRKAKKVFNWDPQFSINEGLSETIKWYDKHFHEKI